MSGDNINKTKKQTPESCPLCGDVNHCGNLSSSNPSELCWCLKGDVAFPQSLLGKVADADKNKACICKSCALKHGSAES